ncbi:amidohydrolase family protein [Microlunatus soli]|uniref:Dihydropyrimidinase n=1 Tax=Microlunatus soli TaxID=630515 RepID=A0A1H1Y9G7_9ACTN|nr:amidohydrolase family protein [Microlunatus soli]SDT18178.1 dihydropyrimidinase [Microlunatus soli]
MTEPDTRPQQVIRGGHVVTAHDEGAFDVGITDGRIVAIGAPGTVTADRVLDARGCIVMPGGIDPHTHIAWPLASGGTGHDDFGSATARAAAWGTTAVIDFVPGRQGSLIAAAEERLEQAGASVIDYTLHPVITELNAERNAEIAQLISMGLSSFKVYTTYDSRMETADIRRFIRVAAEAGGLPGFHAEHHALLTDALAATRTHGPTTIPRFPQSRPGHTERASIREIVGFAEEFDSPVYIYHVSGLDAFGQIQEARSVGVDVRAETCAHYLVHDDSAYQRKDGWKYVITPPIRSQHDRDGLWQAVADGTLNAVASDHCCYSLADKSAGFQDFTAMEPGAPGIASRMPMLWNFGVNSGRLTTRQFVDINSRIPAETFGLGDKGRIEIGADADIVVWDPDASWTWSVGEPETANGSDYDIYDGIAGHGRPRYTLSRGRTVFGPEVSGAGHGQFIAQRIR